MAETVLRYSVGPVADTEHTTMTEAFARRAQARPQRYTLMIFAGLYFVLVVAALRSSSLAELDAGTETESSYV